MYCGTLSLHTQLRGHTHIHTRTHTHSYSYSHSLTHSLTHPLIHSHTHPHTRPPTHSPTHSPVHPLTHPPTHPPNHPPTHPLTHPLTAESSDISAVDEEEEVEGDGTTIVCALVVELREINDGKYRYLTSYTCISGIHMYRDSNPCTSEF